MPQTYLSQYLQTNSHLLFPSRSMTATGSWKCCILTLDGPRRAACFFIPASMLRSAESPSDSSPESISIGCDVLPDLQVVCSFVNSLRLSLFEQVYLFFCLFRRCGTFPICRNILFLCFFGLFSLFLSNYCHMR